MKILQRISFVDVVGQIWMPNAICSMRYSVSKYDLEHMRDDDGKITRDGIEQWLTTHSGDFQSIQDFHASIEDGDTTIDIPFATEDGEMAYYDTIAEEN